MKKEYTQKVAKYEGKKPPTPQPKMRKKTIPCECRALYDFMLSIIDKYDIELLKRLNRNE